MTTNGKPKKDDALEDAKAPHRKFQDTKGQPLTPLHRFAPGTPLVTFFERDIPAFAEALGIPVSQLQAMAEDGVVIVRSP